jgi:CBS domain-containing protein
MKVSDLMTREVCACWSNESLDRAARLMWESDCGSLPVLDQNGRVTGMITDRDVCMAAYTQTRLLVQIPVWRAMSPALYSCGPEEELGTVEARMRSNQVRRLPVVDDDGRLRGILSLADIAQVAAREGKANAVPGKKVSFAEVGATLAAVTAPRRRELAAVAS